MTVALNRLEIAALEECISDPEWPALLKSRPSQHAAWREAAVQSLLTGTVWYVPPAVPWEPTGDQKVVQFRVMFDGPRKRTPGYPRPFLQNIKKAMGRRTS